MVLFIGEFGWELLFWKGWVNKIINLKTNKNDKIIVSSYPGRYPLYSSRADFWPLSDSFLGLNASSHGYITDGWKNGYPGYQYSESRFNIKSSLISLKNFKLPERKTHWFEEPIGKLNIHQNANEMLNQFKNNLKHYDTEYFIPWKWNSLKAYDNIEFGVNIDNIENPLSTIDYTKRIEFKDQLLQHLSPIEKGNQYLIKNFPRLDKMICIFPRYRSIRRPDKNWSEEKYLSLIEKLKKMNYQVGVFGEPGGTYFVKNKPDGVLDFINIPNTLRLDIQLAALKQSLLAVGSMSGALLVSLATGTPSLIWGEQSQELRYYKENYTFSKMIYYSDLNPSVNDIVELINIIKKNEIKIMKILILGAGPAGCACAYMLNQLGYDNITIVENNLIGGCAHTRIYNNIPYEFGPQIMYTDEKRLQNIFEKFLIQHAPKTYDNEYHPALLVDGTLENVHDFPITISNVLKQEDPVKIIEELYHVNLDKPDFSNFENYMISRIGNSLYEKYVKNYNIKQWKIHPSKMDAEWAKFRNLTLRKSPDMFKGKWQGHPGDYNPMWDGMLKNVNIKKGHAYVNDNYDQVLIDGSNVINEYDLILNTLLLNSKLDYISTF